MQLSKCRKPKFLLDERITEKNRSLSVRRRRESSPPGKTGSQGGGAETDSLRSVFSKKLTEAAGGRNAREPVGSRAQVGCGCPTGKGPGPGSLQGLARAAEKPPRQQTRGGAA